MHEILKTQILTHFEKKHNGKFDDFQSLWEYIKFL